MWPDKWVNVAKGKRKKLNTLISVCVCMFIFARNFFHLFFIFFVVVGFYNTFVRQCETLLAACLLQRAGHQPSFCTVLQRRSLCHGFTRGGHVLFGMQTRWTMLTSCFLCRYSPGPRKHSCSGTISDAFITSSWPTTWRRSSCHTGMRLFFASERKPRINCWPRMCPCINRGLIKIVSMDWRCN